METIKGSNMQALPFSQLTEVKTLLFFEDSPVLVHYRDENQKDILCYWIDYDEVSIRWMYTKVTKQELYNYVSGKWSLKQLLKNISAEYAFIVDSTFSDANENIVLLEYHSIPEYYMPQRDIFYSEPLSDFYSRYLDEFRYIDKLREQSYIIKVEPKGRSHENTVSVKDATLVLSGLCKSMEGYISVCAFNLLKQTSSDVNRINKKINNYKKRLSPRISQAAFGSFEVWLAMDVVTFHGEDQMEKNFRECLVDGYKKDVLDVNYSDDKDAEVISEKFTPEERKKIFEPIFKILEADEYSISFTNNDKSFFTAVRKSVTETFKEVIIPKPTIEQAAEDISRKNRIYQVVLNLPEGKDISTLKKKELLDGLLFSEESAEAIYPITSPIIGEDFVVNLKTSLKCNLQIESNSLFTISHSILDLHATGENFAEVVKEIKVELAMLFKYYLVDNPDIIDDQKTFLSSILNDATFK